MRRKPIRSPSDTEYEPKERLASKSTIARVTAEIRAYENLGVLKRQHARLATIFRSQLTYRSADHARLTADHIRRRATTAVTSTDRLLDKLDELSHEQKLRDAEAPRPRKPRRKKPRKKSPPKSETTVDVLSDIGGKRYNGPLQAKKIRKYYNSPQVRDARTPSRDCSQRCCIEFRNRVPKSRFRGKIRPGGRPQSGLTHAGGSKNSESCRPDRARRRPWRGRYRDRC